MELHRASLLRRLGAYLFDQMLVSFAGLAMALWLGNGELPEPGERSGMISISVSYLLFFFRDAVRGISPGRFLAGIMVRDNDNPLLVPSFPKRFLRNVMLALWPVELISMFTNIEFRRLGDRAANSVVLLNPRRARVLGLLPLLLGLGTFAGYAVADIVMLKSSEPYQQSIEYISSSAEARVRTGGVEGFGIKPAGHFYYEDKIDRADLLIVVKGREHDITASVHLEKPYSRWIVRSCEFTGRD